MTRAGPRLCQSARQVVRCFRVASLAAVLLIPSGCLRRETPVQFGNRGQILHRGTGQEPSDLDPHLATQAVDTTVLSALLEGLVAEDPADLHPVPGVARSWEASPDGISYTFHLRGDARWSNGDPVTAGDFVASWRRVLTPSLGAPNASQLYILQRAEAFNRGSADFAQVGVAAPDARTLRVTLEHPASWFLSLLSQPAWMPVHIPTLSKYGPAAARGNPWARPGRFVGNGPFDLKAWRQGQEIVVARSPTYWDRASVRLREIHFHAIDSLDAEERAFRSGQLHVTEAIPLSRIDAYRRDAPRLLRTDPLLGTYYYRVNVRRPGLGDPRIRKALALALDRVAIVEKIARGGEEAASAFLPSGMGGYVAPPGQRADAAEARRLLAAAGHPGGSGLPTFDLLYNTSETHRVIAEAVQEMWRRELGIQVRLVNEDLKSTLEARAAGDYDLLRSSWIADYAEPSAGLGLWRRDDPNNCTGWTNPDFDSLLFTAARTPDPAARNALYAKAEALLLDDAPVIPIYHYTHVFLLQPSVQGWNPTLLDHHPYKNVWLSEIP